MSRFEEWWNDQDNGAPAMVFETEESMAKAAFNAGVAAERERCAGIAENMIDRGKDEKSPVYDLACQDIAAAIRSAK